MAEETVQDEESLDNSLESLNSDSDDNSNYGQRQQLCTVPPGLRLRCAVLWYKWSGEMCYGKVIDESGNSGWVSVLIIQYGDKLDHQSVVKRRSTELYVCGRYTVEGNRSNSAENSIRGSNVSQLGQSEGNALNLSDNDGIHNDLCSSCSSSSSSSRDSSISSSDKEAELQQMSR